MPYHTVPHRTIPHQTIPHHITFSIDLLSPPPPQYLCQLENELRTHQAAEARQTGCPSHQDIANGYHDDIPTWCWSEEYRDQKNREAEWPSEEEEADQFSPRSGRQLPPDAPEGLSWYPEGPEWIRKELSWAQRHLVDVYAVYGALVMGVGLLMKLTWNLVW